MALDPHEILFFLPILGPPPYLIYGPRYSLFFDLLGLDIIPPSMDTTNYDAKVAELRAAASQRQLAKESVDKIIRAGRPKGPEKVVYKRNVSPDMVKRMDEFLKRSTSDDPEPATPVHHGDPSGVILSGQSALDELKKQLAMVLEDNDRLSKEVATIEHRLSRVARLTDNEKLILWIRKYDDLKKAYDLRVGGSEFSQ